MNDRRRILPPSYLKNNYGGLLLREIFLDVLDLAPGQMISRQNMSLSIAYLFDCHTLLNKSYLFYYRLLQVLIIHSQLDSPFRAFNKPDNHLPHLLHESHP